MKWRKLGSEHSCILLSVASFELSLVVVEGTIVVDIKIAIVFPVEGRR